MLLWIRKQSRRAIIAMIAMCAWTGIYPGIYFYTVTAQAGTFLNNAQAGENTGASAIGSAQYDASNQGAADFNGLGWQAPPGQMTAIESYYKPGNVGRAGGNALNQYAGQQGALLQDTTCPSGFPGSGNIVSDFDAAQTACNHVWVPFQAASEQLFSSDPTFGATFQSLQQSWQSAFASASSTVNGLASDCTQAPACDMITASELSSSETALESTTSGLPEIQSYCASLPLDPTVSASSLQAEATDLQSVATNLQAMTYGNQGVQGIYDTCTYAQSYELTQQGTGGFNGFTSGANSFDQSANSSSFLNTTEGQSLETAIMPIVQGNPSVFAQYYTPSDCTSTTTLIQNGNTTVSTPSTTGITGGTAPNQTIACNESSVNSSLIQKFPDANAEWIWGDGSQCGNVPSGTSETLMASYDNGGSANTAPAISATVYFAALDNGTLTINNPSTGQSTSVTYNDNGTTPMASNTPNGWVQQAVTIEPGISTISISVQGNNKNGDAASAIASIISSTGKVLLDTNTSNTWSMVTGATTPVTTTTTAGSGVTVGSPSASVTSNICTGTPFRCLGTECHGLIGNQNLDFAKAVTASSALQMMQTSIQCAAGTSVAAGNCIPIIFQGKEEYCRTWPFAGSFTNNCCAEGMQGAGINMGQYVSLIVDSYKVSESPMVAGTVFALPADWGASAYSTLSNYAGQAWSEISQPFVNLAESVAQDMAKLGANALSSITGGMAGTSAQLISSISSSASTVVTSISSVVTNAEASLNTMAQHVLMDLGVQTTQDAAAIIADVVMFVNVIMIIYAIYQIVKLLAQMLTACKQEEFQLGNSRKEHDCALVGTYCAQSAPIIGCLMHKTTFCCYQSPLAMIIASQIQEGQPNVAGGYGAAQNPNCAGFTPQQLATVNWSEINLSQWLALLEQGGLIQTSNAAAAAANPQSAIAHPTGQANG
ncbi:conjugal transfer protein TraN [Acidithiobacillus sp. MC6.1]|nr:conjugal transfer protein TraN [Acidithiobacillus sp. MC6.1]